MAKAYWVVQYRKVNDADALAAYAKLAGPATAAQGARPLVRGLPAKVYDDGRSERTVVLEFPSLEAAVAARESAAYQEALAVLGDGCERDFRIVEGT